MALCLRPQVSSAATTITSVTNFQLSPSSPNSSLLLCRCAAVASLYLSVVSSYWSFCHCKGGLPCLPFLQPLTVSIFIVITFGLWADKAVSWTVFIFTMRLWRWSYLIRKASSSYHLHRDLWNHVPLSWWLEKLLA